MKLQIGDYKITSDGMCITLSGVKIYGPDAKNPGESYDVIIGHYPNLEQALIRLLEEKMASFQGMLISDLINEIRAVKAEIVHAVYDAGMGPAVS